MLDFHLGWNDSKCPKIIVSNFKVELIKINFELDHEHLNIW